MQAHISKQSIKVLIIDDLPQVREGLCIMLELAGSLQEPKIEVVGKACNATEAMQQAWEVLPDVILVDLESPGLDGYAFTRSIKTELPAIRIIILSIHDDVQVQERARGAGADGFVTKGDRYENLMHAILGD